MDFDKEASEAPVASGSRLEPRSQSPRPDEAGVTVTQGSSSPHEAGRVVSQSLRPDEAGMASQSPRPDEAGVTIPHSPSPAHEASRAVPHSPRPHETGTAVSQSPRPDEAHSAHELGRVVSQPPRDEAGMAAPQSPRPDEVGVTIPHSPSPAHEASRAVPHPPRSHETGTAVSQSPRPDEAGMAVPLPPRPHEAGTTIPHSPGPHEAGRAVSQPTRDEAAMAVPQPPRPHEAGMTIPHSPGPHEAGRAVSQSPRPYGPTKALPQPPRTDDAGMARPQSSRPEAMVLPRSPRSEVGVAFPHSPRSETGVVYPQSPRPNEYATSGILSTPPAAVVPPGFGWLEQPRRTMSPINFTRAADGGTADDNLGANVDLSRRLGSQHEPENRNSMPRGQDTQSPMSRKSNLDWIVPLDGSGSAERKGPYRSKTVGERLEPTLLHAETEREKYAFRAKLTGIVLNLAIGLQVLLGAITTAVSASTTGKNTSIAVSVIGGLSTLVASYLARVRGTNEPELSTLRMRDLDQFIRECKAFQMDAGHLDGPEHDAKVRELRSKFEELLGNGSGERRLSTPL